MGYPPQAPLPQQPQPQIPFNIDFQALFNANKPAGSKLLLEAIGKKRKGDMMSLVFVDFLPVNPMLMGDVALQLESTVVEMGKVEKLDLVLRSTGGIAEFPWRIVSVLRSFCDELEVVVPRQAMSGATHIAISADNLVMGPLSALGSVDPTRNHPLLPQDRTGNPIPASVQDLRHCLEFVKRNVPKDEVGEIVGQLFSHVNPLAIGAIEQSYELSRLITRKVLGTRKRKLPARQVETIVDQLAGKYFSHGYPISRNEVVSDLKLPVTKANPGDELFKAIEKLNEHYTEVFKKDASVPGAPVPLKFRVTGFLETPKKRRVLCQVFGPTAPQPLAGSWISDDNS